MRSIRTFVIQPQKKLLTLIFSWEYIHQRHDHLTQHPNWRQIVNEAIDRSPDIEIDGQKRYHIKPVRLVRNSEKLDGRNLKGRF